MIIVQYFSTKVPKISRNNNFMLRLQCLLKMFSIYANTELYSSHNTSVPLTKSFFRDIMTIILNGFLKF